MALLFWAGQTHAEDKHAVAQAPEAADGFADPVSARQVVKSETPDDGKPQVRLVAKAPRHWYRQHALVDAGAYFWFDRR